METSIIGVRTWDGRGGGVEKRLPFAEDCGSTAPEESDDAGLEKLTARLASSSEIFVTSLWSDDKDS